MPTKAHYRRPMTLAPWLRTRWSLLVVSSLLWGLVLAVSALLAPLPSEAVDIGWLVLATLQGVLIFRVVHHPHSELGRARSARLRLAWAALLLATGLGLVGDLLWYLAPDGDVPLADLVYLLEYPFWFLGLLFIPVESRHERFGPRLIDALIVFVAASLVVWDLVLRPLSSTSPEPLTLVLAGGPAVGDVVLLAVIGITLSRRPLPSTGAALLWLAWAMLAFVVVDLVYVVAELKGTYTAGETWLDPAWALARTLLMLAALRQRDPTPDTRFERTALILDRGAAILPLIAMGLGFVFIVAAVLRGEDGSVGTALVAAVLCLLVLIRQSLVALLNARLAARLTIETERSERLLRNVLPEAIAHQLKGGRRDHPLAERFDEATVVFADLVGFTPLSRTMSPDALVAVLDAIFSRFDHLAAHHGLEKIKTIGDAYMAAAGVPERRADHVAAAAHMALAMRDSWAALRAEIGLALDLRIGLHTGPLVAGVIGQSKFAYDLWGDTVNLASRMESHGEPSRIHVTEEVYLSLRDTFDFEARGLVDIKGRGPLMTHFLLSLRAAG